MLVEICWWEVQLGLMRNEKAVGCVTSHINSKLACIIQADSKPRVDLLHHESMRTGLSTVLQHF